MLVKILSKLPFVAKIKAGRLETNDAIDTLHSRIDISDEFFEQFQKDRTSSEYQGAFEKAEPLVSVCICTYNRAHLVVERCIKSLLRQDYKNFEIVVVGDNCTDETETLVKKIRDSRLLFHNLEQRGQYPTDPYLRWMVAGTTPINKSLDLAKGDFITHLDDDDEHPPERISRLVQFIKKERVDFVWHPFWYELPSGQWKLNPADHFRKGAVTTSSSFYHRWFARMPWDVNSYRYNEPGDWNRFRKIKYLHPKMARFPEPLLKHYRERNQSAR
jgi:glycosyltransferase involved in cell wall biosynthesis